MLRLIALLTLLAALPAQAGETPPCYPNDVGCTPGYVAHFTGDAPGDPLSVGMCVMWFDLLGLMPQEHYYCFRYVDITPGEDGWSIADLWFGALTKAQKDAVYTSLVTSHTTPTELAAAETLLGYAPESVFEVAPTQDLPDRATYYVIDGVRHSSKQRIAIGAPCYPQTYGDGKYMAIRPTQPIEVAVCVRR